MSVGEHGLSLVRLHHTRHLAGRCAGAGDRPLFQFRLRFHAHPRLHHPDRPLLLVGMEMVYAPSVDETWVASTIITSPRITSLQKGYDDQAC